MVTGSVSHKLKIFISYGREDITNDFAIKLYEDLKTKGYEPILDAKNFIAGEQLSEVIANKIADCHVMLVILSEKYSKSDWCRAELAFANKQKKKLIIVRRQNCDVSNEVQFILGNGLYLSFIGNDSYEKEFAKLLRALEKVITQLSYVVGKHS